MGPGTQPLDTSPVVEKERFAQPSCRFPRNGGGGVGLALDDEDLDEARELSQRFSDDVTDTMVGGFPAVLERGVRGVPDVCILGTCDYAQEVGVRVVGSALIGALNG